MFLEPIPQGINQYNQTEQLLLTINNNLLALET